MLARRAIRRTFTNFWANNRSGTERVVSTPQWPVPYHKRMVKAYPVRDTSNQFNLPSTEIGLEHWWQTKEILNSNAEGKQIMDMVENLPLNCKY